MALQRTDFTQALTKKGYEIFWDNYVEVDNVWEGLFRQEPLTSGAYIERASMIGLGDLTEKGENEPFTYDIPADGWPVLGKVRTFAKGFAFSMELYEDTQIENLFSQYVAQWGEAYMRTRDRFYSNFLNNGALLTGHEVFDNTVPGVKIDPTGKFIYDGKPFFADAGNAHPLKMCDKTIVNYFPLPLTHENFATVWQSMTINNAFDEKGDEINLAPDTLVIHPSLKFKVKEILESEFLPSVSGTPSIRNPLRGLVSAVIEWRRLDDPNGWFLMQRQRGLVALNRKELSLDVWVDPETKQVKATVNCRFGGYVDNCRYTTACNIRQS